MPKSYEWALIPFPYLRTFNLFTAFVMNALCVGIITAFSIESRAYFIHLEKKESNFQELQQQNHVANLHYNAKRDDFVTPMESNQPYNFKLAFHRAMRVSLVSTLISFSVYVLMYFIFGYGGGMVSMRRQFRFFSDIPA